ncbi:MAG: hypothetical protein PHP50_14210 [Lachnospiraceae bacterium]|nr:hypothetical protein [Lachnospiraceae bacterium]
MAEMDEVNVMRMCGWQLDDICNAMIRKHDSGKEKYHGNENDRNNKAVHGCQEQKTADRDVGRP